MALSGSVPPSPSATPSPALDPDTPTQGLGLALASIKSSLPPALAERSMPALVAAATALAVVVAFVVVMLRPGTTDPPDLVLPKAVPGGEPPVASSTTSPGSAGSGLATVHAAGAVAHPGIYVVPAGSRVADVVTAAGGPVAGAELDRLNLAAKINDGDRVYVPRKGEMPAPEPGVSKGPAPAPGGAPGAAPTPATPVDLNSADEKQLDALPGVGPATAKSILTYRSEHGRFRSVDELLEVPGIGPAKMEKLRPLVKV